MAANRGYEAKKSRAAAVSAEQSRQARDVAPFPPVNNPARRVEAHREFRVFCEQYFPHTFTLGWSMDHRRMIERIETAVVQGGQFAMAMPRGSGKTSLTETAALWAVLYGYHEFVCLIGSDEAAAMEMLDSIKTELQGNDRLYEDFPEVIHPIRRLEGIAHRANAQLFNGELTHIVWGVDEVVLPTIRGSRASGAVIRVAGLTGRIRGMKFKRPDGRSVRPSLVIPDDPQTDESAHSPSQCAQRERILGGAVMGLAGPGRKISAIMPCTVICPGDLADRLLDRQKHPEWQGERTKLMYAMPTNNALWNQYAEIRANSLRANNQGREATEFYRDNREAMDEGALPAWPMRYNQDEISAVQHAMNLKLNDERSFFAEYQNEPMVESLGEEMLTSEEIEKKTNGLPRGQVPIGCDHIVAYVDVQGKLLYWLVAAFGQGFTGAVIDYGAFPEQPNRGYFTLSDARRTLSARYPGKGQEGQIYAGLDDLFTQLSSRVWRRGDGAEMRLSRAMIDANWGESTDTVYLFCRQSKHASLVMPAHGRYVGASSMPWESYTRKPGEVIGNHWMIPNVKAKRAVRHVLMDVNWYKAFIHARLRVAMGDPGCLSLFSPKEREGHRMLAEHILAEYGVKTEGRGRSVMEFKLKPGRPDNHFLDCLVGAFVCASMLGVDLQAAGQPARKATARKRRRVSYIE